MKISAPDIKGANILVDNNGTIKLADFGAAKQLSGEFRVISSRILKLYAKIF